MATEPDPWKKVFAMPGIPIPRPRLSYANVASTLALVLAMSMGGAYAHGKIGSAQLKQNAVKSRHIGFQHVKTPDLAKRAVPTNRIRAKAVTRGKLAPGARGAKVVQYLAGGHAFSSGSNSYVSVKLPGSWTTSKIRASTWAAQLIADDPSIGVPGPATGGSYGVAAFIADDGNGYVRIFLDDGPGFAYDAIRVTRIVRTASSDAALSRPRTLSRP